jgi:5-methylcytosine-specific restriction endonuclease McrA
VTVTDQQRQHIRQLAAGCCEYCRLITSARLATFQIDHIIPVKHGGSDELDNLSLSCMKCNGFKGSNVAALDPLTGDAAKLYNPRRQRWDDHFQLNPNATIQGLSPEGRTTVNVMRMNEASRLRERRMLMLVGEYPC